MLMMTLISLSLAKCMFFQFIFNISIKELSIDESSLM